MCAVHPLHILKQLYEKGAIKRAVCPKPHLCFPAMLGNLRKAISSFHKPSFFEGSYVWNKRYFFQCHCIVFKESINKTSLLQRPAEELFKKLLPSALPTPWYFRKRWGVVSLAQKPSVCRGSQRMRQLHTSDHVPFGTVTAVRSCFPS